MLSLAWAEQSLLRDVQSEWHSRGIRCLIVHSDSPTRRAHLESEWLPRLRHVGCTLNGSESASQGGEGSDRVPLVCGLLLAEYLGRRLILQLLPVVRSGTPPGSMVNLGLFVVMIDGVAPSSRSSSHAPAGD